MVTYYAALGRYELEKLRGGAQRPVLFKAGQEFGVTVKEYIVWNAVLWNILDYKALRADCLRKAAQYGVGMNEEDFDGTLGRLVNRGLVACGQGYTGAAALYALLEDVFPSPVQLSPVRKLLGFLMLLLRGYPFSVARHILDTEELDDNEQRVWKLICRQEMSTAEVIRCVDLGVRDVSTSAKVVAGIYKDGVDYKNVGSHAQLSPRMYGVLAAVANLYLKRMVILENTIY